MDSLVSLMEKRIGLDIGSIGESFFQKVVIRRMAACGLSSTAGYFQLVQTANTEMRHLIEELTIPETWFYRNPKQLSYFSEYIKTRWKARKEHRPLRILSFPCATGEEPYTLAMILFDAGVSPARFHIDGADISPTALKKAQTARYGRRSFRGGDLEFRDRFFTKDSGEFQLLSTVREKVTFVEGNIMDGTFLRASPQYDIIFSRNLFIYFNSTAKDKAARLFSRLLNQEGLLFMGHSEEYPFGQFGMERIRCSGIYAYQKTKSPPTPLGKALSPVTNPSGPEMQKSKKPHLSSHPVPPPVIEKPPGKNMEPCRREPEAEEPFQPDADSSAHLFDKARYLADKGQLDSALSLCENILKRNSAFTEAYFLKGVIYGARDENGMAGDCFNRVLYLDPGHLEALRYLEILAEQAGDPIKAGMIRERMKRVQKKKAVS